MDEPKVYVCFEQNEEHCEKCGYAECCEFCRIEEKECIRVYACGIRDDEKAKENEI